MRFVRIIFKVMVKMFWLFAWLIVCGFALLVCEGPEQMYILDPNYQLWRWPGTLIRLEPPPTGEIGFEYINVLETDSRINAFAVLDEFVVGKTTDGWFAVNRETHRVWYPYPLQEALESACGVVFSDLQLTTSWPWSRVIISSHTKVILPLITLLFCTPLIGFRRIRRSFNFLIKWKFGLFRGSQDSSRS